MEQQKKLSGTRWLHRKPESALDWLGVVCTAILFYVVLTNIGLVLDVFGSVAGVLTPFAAGVVIAYVINPIVEALMKYVFRGKRKLYWLAMLLGYIIAFLLVGVLVYLVVTQVLSSLNDFIGMLDVYAQNLIAKVRELDAEHQWGVMAYLGNPDELLKNTGELQAFLERMMGSDKNLSTELGEVLKDILSGAYGALWEVGSGLVMGLTALASSVYLLIAKKKLLRHARILTRAFLPRNVAETVLRICHDANRNLTGFFTGKILDSTIIGILTFICMEVIGLDYAPMISVIVGITNIIPVFGPFIGAIPGIVILLLAEPMQALEFAILILAIQQLDGNFIGPKILGDSIGIGALWVLFSIVVGNSLFGLVGMVIGVPMFATIYSLVKEFAEWCLRHRGIDKEGKPLVPVQEAPVQEAAPAKPSASQRVVRHVTKKWKNRPHKQRSRK